MKYLSKNLNTCERSAVGSKVGLEICSRISSGIVSAVMFEVDWRSGRLPEARKVWKRSMVSAVVGWYRVLVVDW